jgi:Xaa-Pro aminopeptidase
MEVMAAIDAQGEVTLVLPVRKLEIPKLATRTVGYEAKWLSTMRDDQREASTLALLATIQGLPNRIATEFSRHSQYLPIGRSCELVDLEPTMFQLRRHKYPDELALLAHANRANQKMYQRAREMIAPGLTELEFYSELHRTAIAELSEPLTYFGQDFQCNSRGGAPRDRPVEAGELYILDLGVGFRGYFSDNARTLSVTSPTESQLEAWTHLASIFPLIESTVRPGVSCAKLFNTVQERLAAAEPWVFNHHLGHGVGLAPHEGPHLNPLWDDTFAVGDYFTAEPGLYHPDLNAGIRLEQNYLVTETGVELLTPWPLELC